MVELDVEVSHRTKILNIQYYWHNSIFDQFGLVQLTVIEAFPNTRAFRRRIKLGCIKLYFRLFVPDLGQRSAGS